MLLASTNQQKLAAVAGLPQPQEAYRCDTGARSMPVLICMQPLNHLRFVMDVQTGICNEVSAKPTSAQVRSCWPVALTCLRCCEPCI